MSKLTFKSFIQELRESADLTRDPNAPLNPTAKNCFFCPARLTCKAREELALGTVLESFDDLTKPVRKPLDSDRLGQLYELIPLVTEWAKDVEARMYMALDNGKVVTNTKGERYKFVTGRAGHRKWLDEAAVLAAAKELKIKDDYLFSKSLLSPAQIEKFAAVRKSRKKDAPPPPDAPIGPVKWKRLAEFIVQPEGKAEIALESDPRPTRHTLTGVFDDVSAPAAAPAAEPEIDLFN